MISNCVVCSERTARYKCITCRIPFCSADCNKIHKGSESCKHNVVDVPSEKLKGADRRFDTEDSIAPQVLERLGSSSEIRKLLNDRELRETLAAVDRSEDGAAAVGKAMEFENFQKFVDHCIAVVNDNNS